MNNKILIGVACLLGVVFLVGLYFYSKKLNPVEPQKQQIIDTQTPQITEGLKKGEIGYKETQTKIEIGTGGLFRGTYEKIEENKIFVRNSDLLTTYPLTTDELTIQCTSQDLSNPQELDYKLVNNVKITSAVNGNKYLTQNENIVILSQEINGVITAHTVFKNDANCNSEIFSR